jgi:hypothetical protein
MEPVVIPQFNSAHMTSLPNYIIEPLKIDTTVPTRIILTVLTRWTTSDLTQILLSSYENFC